MPENDVTFRIRQTSILTVFSCCHEASFICKPPLEDYSLKFEGAFQKVSTMSCLIRTAGCEIDYRALNTCFLVFGSQQCASIKDEMAVGGDVDSVDIMISEVVHVS